MLKKCIRHDIGKSVNNIFSTHESNKKCDDETIKNLSSYKLAEEKVEILNYGLKHPIERKH